MTRTCYANPNLYKRLVMLSDGRDTVGELIDTLRREMPIEKVIDENSWERRCWVELGIRYRKRKRIHEALQLFHALYERLLERQIEVGRRKHINKGDSLYEIAISHSALGHPVLARRYMMLALCEDAVEDQGKVEPYTVATYGWLVGRLGLSQSKYDRYVSAAWRLWQGLGEDALFPELILQELGQEWMTEYPDSREVGVYVVNGRCVQHLLNGLGRSRGVRLETLAAYLVGSMPGCRTYRRMRSGSTDYDVVGIYEGPAHDFRSEFGRYFLCECKDWRKPANFTTLAKFCRVLDSVKFRFGVLFSSAGITGQGKTSDAEREQLKFYQDRGTVIVVVSKADLREIADGGNFVTMLRRKYEQVRLDARSDVVAQ